MKPKTMSTKELTREMLKDPEFRQEYEALHSEFALARALIRARSSAGLTQTDVAKKMGTDQSFIARIEGGKRKPSLSTLERYASAVGRTLRIQLV